MNYTIIYPGQAIYCPW